MPRAEELVPPLVDEAGLDVAGDEGLAAAQALEELDVGAEAGDLVLAQGEVELADGRLAVAAADDELGDHAVVGLRDGVALDEAGVDAHVGVGRRRGEVHQPARVREEAAVRVLGVDAGLDGGAALADARLDLVLRQRQPLAGRDPELPLDQVGARHHLADGVLDLQARVHLHKVEGARVLVQDELDGAGADVADGQRRRARLVPQVAAGGVVEPRRGALLEDLLVAALHAAVALAQRDAVAVAVGEDLHLDVARAHHVLLDQHHLAAVAEAGARLGAGAAQLRLELGVAAHDAHALAAAALGALEQHGVADGAGAGAQLLGRLLRAVVARHARHAGRRHDLLAAGLVAHVGHGARRRADEDDAGLLARPRERRVLAQEAVPRVQRLDAVLLGERHDPRPVQVAARRRPERDRVRRAPGVLRRRVDVGVERRRADAHGGGGAGDAQRDLAAVGDQERLDGRDRGRAAGAACRGRDGAGRRELPPPGRRGGAERRPEPLRASLEGAHRV